MLCCAMLNHFSHIQLLATPWTAAHQALLSMGEYKNTGKNTRVGCRTLLEVIFLIQGLNPYFLSLPCWQLGSLSLVLPGKPSLF